VTDASAPSRRSDIVGNVVRAPSARLSAWRRLDRYAARYENFVLVVRPQSGPARGAPQKETGNQPRGSGGISRGGAPWTAMRPVTTILYSLWDRIAVRRAERAKKRLATSQGDPQGYQGAEPLGWLGLGALTLTFACAITVATLAQEKEPARFGIGRAASADEIRALDIDVMPDGTGLPPGHGTVSDGAATYAAKCASCHGASGEGKPFDRLVGRESGKGFDFATDPGLVRTVGNYWPYATTLFDYTARTMPFMQPGTLSANEVYGLVAYLLHLNQIVPADAVMDRNSLPKVVMPARDRFVRDNRTGGKVVK
jgi:hypothetical protein